METAYTIVEKPASISWEAVRDLVWTAHSDNRNQGILVRNTFLSADEIRDKIGSQGKLWLALSDGRPIGSLAMVPRYFDLWSGRGTYGYCSLIVVLPEYRGKGVYRELCRVCEQEARNRGYSWLMFDVHALNRRMQEIGEHGGFHKVGCQYWGEHFSYLMVKWLDGNPPSRIRCGWRFFLSTLKAKVKKPFVPVQEASCLPERAVIIGQGFTGRLGLVRSLAAAGCSSRLIILYPRSRDGKPYEAKNQPDALSKYVTECFYCENYNEEMLLDYLLNKCAESGKKPLIVPDNDFSAAFVDAHRETLSGHFLLPHGKGDADSVEAWMDKSRQKALARAVGLNVAEASVVESGDYGGPLPSAVHYPCFVKPLASLAGGKMWLARCDEEAELRKCMKYAYDRRGNLRMLVEDFKVIETEYATVGFTDGEDVVIPGILQIVQMGKGWHFGVAVQGKVLPPDGWDEILDKFRELVRRTGFKGLFDIDFYRSEGKIYFCELNLRFGGSGYAFTRLGVNLPQMMLQSFSGKPWDRDARIESSAYYFNERMGRDEWYFGRISWKAYCQIRDASQIRFLQDKNDPVPERAYRRETAMLRIKLFFKKLTGSLQYHTPYQQ